MRTINNLTYELKVGYVNDSGLNVFINQKMNDNGIEVKSIQVGDVTITEETTEGRVLSGRFDNGKSFCGYCYNYERNDADYLVNINKDIPLETGISLINKTKMDSNFLTAKMVFNSILRNDYRVCLLREGELNITKIVTAENEDCEKCSFQESISLSKQNGMESFVEIFNEKTYKIDGNTTIENGQNTYHNDIKTQVKELEDIAKQNPKNYKELISLKDCIGVSSIGAF